MIKLIVILAAFTLSCKEQVNISGKNTGKAESNQASGDNLDSSRDEDKDAIGESNVEERRKTSSETGGVENLNSDSEENSKPQTDDSSNSRIDFSSVNSEGKDICQSSTVEELNEMMGELVVAINAKNHKKYNPTFKSPKCVFWQTSIPHIQIKGCNSNRYTFLNEQEEITDSETCSDICRDHYQENYDYTTSDIYSNPYNICSWDGEIIN